MYIIAQNFGKEMYLVYNKNNITGYEYDDYPDTTHEQLGYFWTDKYTAMECIKNNDNHVHPILFENYRAANQFAIKVQHLSQFYVARWKEEINNGCLRAKTHCENH